MRRRFAALRPVVVVPFDFLRFAAALACFERAVFDVVDLDSRFRARFVARLRLAEGAVRFGPSSVSRSACFRVRSLTLPRFGVPSGTPARRAFDNPIAMACFAERAPCLPSRTCSISSRTNSPAAVEALLPSRRSSSARSTTSCSAAASDRCVDRFLPSSFVMHSSFQLCWTSKNCAAASPTGEVALAPKQRTGVGKSCNGRTRGCQKGRCNAVTWPTTSTACRSRSRRFAPSPRWVMSTWQPCTSRFRRS